MEHDTKTKPGLADRFLSSPRWQGIAGLAGLAALAVTLGLLPDLQSPITLQLWFVVLLGFLATVGVMLIAIWLLRFRASEQLRETQPFQPKGEVQDVPDYREAGGLLWPWPRPTDGYWQAICAEHNLPIETRVEMTDDFETRVYVFQFPGAEVGQPHDIQGPSSKDLGGINYLVDIEDRIRADIIADVRKPLGRRGRNR